MHSVRLIAFRGKTFPLPRMCLKRQKFSNVLYRPSGPPATASSEPARQKTLGIDGSDGYDASSAERFGGKSKKCWWLRREQAGWRLKWLQTKTYPMYDG